MKKYNLIHKLTIAILVSVIGYTTVDTWVIEVTILQYIILEISFVFCTNLFNLAVRNLK